MSLKADFEEANFSQRSRGAATVRMLCDVWDFVEKSPRIFEEIHILARSFEDGVCSKLANSEKEATAFDITRSKEKKEEKPLGTKSIQRSAGKGRVSHVGKGLKTSRP